jgi:hypothetical protein
MSNPAPPPFPSLKSSEVTDLTAWFLAKYGTELPSLHVERVRIYVDKWPLRDGSNQTDFVFTTRFWTDICTDKIGTRIRTTASSIDEIPKEEIEKRLDQSMESIRYIIAVEYNKHKTMKAEREALGIR